MCSLLSKFCDGILAVGLYDAVGEAVLHDKALKMLYLMLCWALLVCDDGVAQAGDGLDHCQADDVLGLLCQRCHR